MTQDILNKVALTQLQGVGGGTIKQLISYLGSIEDIFKASKRHLVRIPSVGVKLAGELLNKSSFKKAEEIIDHCNKNKIDIIFYTDHAFPERLKSVYDSPVILYSKGSLKTLNGKAISIVGTRKATNYGKGITSDIISELEGNNCAVISGLAYGIDIEAHKTCLKQGISTYGVLAGGINRIYPKSHWKYAQMMQEKGAILSENPPDTIPDARLFPARNRIIAALSEAVIVVEAAESGGALITANLADSYDKPVFAVPGNLKNTYSKGTNHLIRTQKATIYTCIEDVMEALHWDADKSNQIKGIDHLKLTGEEMAIVELLGNTDNGLQIDEISWKTNIRINQLAGILLTLEFNGLVKSLPGNRYASSLK